MEVSKKLLFELKDQVVFEFFVWSAKRGGKRG